MENFEIKAKKDRNDLYLKYDVSLLADVFEKLRNNSLKIYGLYYRHCLSTPDLSWSAMLKITKIILELISDPEIYIFLKKGTKSRISYISNRYSKAKNKYLKFHITKQELKRVLCLVANNFYGYAIIKFLPTSGFKSINPKKLHLNKGVSNRSKGGIFEVYLKSYKNYTMIIL